jgi:hypothetical protein
VDNLFIGAAGSNLLVTGNFSLLALSSGSRIDDALIEGLSWVGGNIEVGFALN